MTINQRNLTIENMDSLPIRTRVSAVLASVAFQGSLSWRKANLSGIMDTVWTAYSSSDSIDFSDPLHFSVIANDGRSHRIYTVKVNVHQQKPDSTTWDALGEVEALAGMKERKAISWNGLLVVLAENAEGSLTYIQHPLAKAGEWVSIPTIGTSGALVSTLQQQGNSLYVSTSSGQVLQSTNGVDWTPASYPTEEGLLLVGSSDLRLYALLNKKLVSSDGDEWTEESLDDEATKLPDTQITSTYYTLPNGQHRLMLIGATSDETMAHAWAKTWNDMQEESETWMYYVPNRADKYSLSVREDMNIQPYDDGLIAFGGASRDGKHAAMDSVLYSRDHGISWRSYEDDDMLLDAEMQAAGQQAQYIVSAVDDDNYLWVLLDDKAWRGRINRLGFLRQDPR